MKALRAVFLNGSGQPGGGEIALAQLASAVPGARLVLFEDGAARPLFESSGLDVSILPLSESVRKVSKESGVPSPRAAIMAILHMFKVARALRDADVVHCNNQKSWVIGAIASWIARKPVVWHLHDILSVEHFSRTKIRLVVALANWRRARVLANSQASLDAFLAAGGSSARSEVLYNPVDPSPFLQAIPIPGFRESLGAANAPVWGVFSRLASWKGQHIAIQALSQLSEGHLVLVGAPFFGEEPWEAHLKGLVAELGLQQRVHFLGFRKDVPALLASIDGAIHCSTVAEPFGLVILEAQLSGKPVVATAAGGALEIVHPPDDGWLTPPADVDALAEVLKIWSSNPVETAAVGLRSRACATARFEASALSRRFLSILEREARS